MASKRGGLQGYTVQEAQNSSMGQVGSVFLDTAATTFTPTNGNVIVAITMITDNVGFSALTPEDTTKYIGISQAGYEGGGDTLATGDQFPQGMTIFGRWTSVSVQTDGDQILCYVG